MQSYFVEKLLELDGSKLTGVDLFLHNIAFQIDQHPIIDWDDLTLISELTKRLEQDLDDLEN